MTFRWTDAEVSGALGLPLQGSGRYPEYGRISTDSRSVEPGDLFLALSGERFDGHDFLSNAFSQGATGAVVSRPVEAPEGTGLYKVPDTLVALGALANHRRKTLSATVVGITGSSGKTSTKELLGAVLEGSFRTHATPGNLNNRIGLPLTLLSASDEAEVLVLEMGTNEPGEIRALTAIAEPGIGAITTVSETHLEKLGSLEGVMEEKLDLFRGLPEDGIALVGDEPPILSEAARLVSPTVRVTGWSQRAEVQHRPEAAAVAGNGCYQFQWRGEPVVLRMPGRHAVQNALLALAISEALGVPEVEAANRIGTVESGGMRSEVRTLGDFTLLVDCYNANPQSLKAALDLLVKIEAAGPRIAVLGSMLELGDRSEALHRAALEDAMSYPLDLVLATGLFAEVASDLQPGPDGPELRIAEELDRAEELLLDSLEGREVVLLKASRGVAMEKLIPSLERHFGPGKAA
jgi:UDP-N-acetylmuramoyl-tripeptide--D-alanyl-D-alanine ligase